MDPVSEFKQNTGKTIDFIKADLKTVRTGRATSSLIENLPVETYGGQAKLKLLELASITSEGPTSLVVAPFDPSILADIEKAILKSNIGATPQITGGRIMLRFPPLSQDQRQNLIRVVAQKIEEKKVAVRNYRDSARKTIKSSLEKKEITEDDKFRLEKEIDTLTQEFMTVIDNLKSAKETEISQI